MRSARTCGPLASELQQSHIITTAARAVQLDIGEPGTAALVGLSAQP